MQKNNQILDCTLRDGGFTNDFNWSKDFVDEYFKTINIIPLAYVEVGYWKQKNKSSNRFYNINENDLDEFQSKSRIKLSVINDFHYSSKKVDDYPKKQDKILSLIRMTCRIEDLKECVDFLNDLKLYTKIKVSLNIFNFSNYSKNSLNKILSLINKSKVDYIYFADTHGSLNFYNLNSNYNNFFYQLQKKNKKIGFHFHDNIGTAFSNYIYCIENNYKMFDSTLCGIGRGGGNLKTEFLFKEKKLNNFINKYQKELYVPFNIYCLISGRLSVSNLYAGFAAEKKVDIIKFDSFCTSLKGKDKNNFDKNKIKEYFNL